MSQPMDQPPYHPGWETGPTSLDTTYEQTGVHTPIQYTDLTLQRPPAREPAARQAFRPPRDQLSEEDYRDPDEHGGGQDVDRYIDNQAAHGPFYGDKGPRPYGV